MPKNILTNAGQWEGINSQTTPAVTPAARVVEMHSRPLKTQAESRSMTLCASFHKYGDVCGERDGGKFAKRRRRDVLCIGEEE
jgi:hypothetical protein